MPNPKNNLLVGYFSIVGPSSFNIAHHIYFYLFVLDIKKGQLIHLHTDDEHEASLKPSDALRHIYKIYSSIKDTGLYIGCTPNRIKFSLLAEDISTELLDNMKLLVAVNEL